VSETTLVGRMGRRHRLVTASMVHVPNLAPCGRLRRVNRSREETLFVVRGVRRSVWRRLYMHSLSLLFETGRLSSYGLLARG
jgi:hypothetical protein